MPRIPRGQVAGYAYHIINRGNRGAVVFHQDADYSAFLSLLATAKSRFPIEILAFCLMPNHFHLVVKPSSTESLSALMQWWLTSHVRRYHRHFRSHGHVWQGRFKSFPIQQDGHLLTVLRYVLYNPVRAGLVNQPDKWPWSSIHQPDLVDPCLMNMGSELDTLIHIPIHERELKRLRVCVNRQSPYGADAWQHRMAETHGLSSTLRPRGRPAKAREK